MVKKYATLWGMAADGVLDVPVIYLWKNTKGIYVADNVGGALPHGTKVDVLKQSGDWVKVSKTIKHKGKEYPQEGWVKKSLVREEKS